MKMDLHTHTVFSDGKATVAELLHQASVAGVDLLAVTDHFDPNDYRPSIANLSEEALLTHFDLIKGLSESYPDMVVLCGIETVPLADGTLDLSQEVKARCDLVVTSCHYLPYRKALVPGDFFTDEYWELFKQTMLSMAAGEGDILGHCEDYLPIKEFLCGMNTTFSERREICRRIVDRYCDEQYVHALADALVGSGKSCELHCATQTPREWVIERMADRGVTFTVGTDSHSLDSVGQVSWAYDMIDRFGLRLRQMEVRNG